jgi:long-chain acyl-CoA synthetase
MNLKIMLEDAARNFNNKTALVLGDRRVSFAEVDEAANKVAYALLKLGIVKGDRVATIQSSNPEFVTVLFGIFKAGAIAMPLDARYIVDELERLFNDCTPKALIAENPPLDTLIPAMSRFKSIKHIITMEPGYKGEYLSYEKIMATSPASKPKVEIKPEDIAIISYTGGPTQKPHGVALSHKSIYIEAVTSGDVLNQTENDVLIAFALPMYHQFGLTSVLMASIAKGSRVVVVPGTGRSIHAFMEVIEKEKGTIYMGVPYIYALLINVARREGISHDISSMRLCLAGGAPLEIPVMRQFKQYFGMDILDVWGQTESISHATCQPIDGSGKQGASGKPLPCWELKIFDENDKELPTNEPGEMVLRGPYMTGFWNKPKDTAEILRNGWLHTGDIGKIDEDGFLFITGRKRRLIILKGQNVFPQDIEEVLLTHPKIAEVKVTGVPELVRSETIKAMIKLKPGETATEQEIRQFCQGRMCDYKFPKEIVFLEELPESVPLWSRHDYAETEITLE